MNQVTFHEEDHLLQNRERIQSILQQYPNVVSVGVGLKEKDGELASAVCYRVYVHEKKPLSELRQEEIIPSVIDGFPTDVIPYGVVEEADAVEPTMDDGIYRPLKGGIQIKQDSYTNNKKRGGGTLGCLATLKEDNSIVGLTAEHVVRLNTTVSANGSEVGQPWRETCCCCCTKNVIGQVADSREKPDCAIIELSDDIINEIQTGNTLHEILHVGQFKGKALVRSGTHVIKVGAASGLTHGIVKDIRFDEDNILIAPREPSTYFADFGDSGSIVLTTENRVVGLLWGTKRDRFKADTLSAEDENDKNIQVPIKRRTHGVATPIEDVEAALGIIVAEKETIGVTIAVHESDTKTHAIPSIQPPEKNPKLHFVTVKGEGEIVLKATFDQPVSNERIRWSSDNLEISFPDDEDKTTISLSREDTEGSRNIITLLVDGYEVKKLVVWIVWSLGENKELENPLYVTVGQTEVTAVRNFRVVFKIQPASIIPTGPDDDVPDLRGPNITPPPNVPDTDGPMVFNKGGDLSGGARLKWDASISLRSKIINPFGIILPAEGFSAQNFTEYPSSSLVGNYDIAGNPTEDPYIGDAWSPLGEVGISVSIQHSVPHSARPVIDLGINRTLEFRIHHRAFARVELNGHWYVMSDDKLGRLHLNFKKKDETAINEDLNEDGDKDDLVWYGIANLTGNTECFFKNNNFDF